MLVFQPPMKFHFLFIFFLFLEMSVACFNQALAQNDVGSTIVRGQVADQQKKPLYLAHVMIKGSPTGDVTNEEGRFEFEADTSGAVTISASMVGYQAVEKEIILHPGKMIDLNLTMSLKSSSLGEATVTADAFTTGDGEGVTLSPMEVVTTPGAAADILRTLKTFPGVSNIDEGSGLFVRGGDVSEVSFILDQASVVHPYKYESPTGGVFGTIPPFLVSGTYFSTGGFSAKYGNALSAVLAMESKGMPDVTEFNANVGMGALSAGGGVSVVPGKVGVQFSGNRSLSGFMFDVNGLTDEFQKVPESRDGNFSIIAKPRPGTTIKFFNYINDSRVGVRVPKPSFEGIYQSEEQNQLHNVQWKQLWGDWLLKTSFSVNRYQNDHFFGGLNFNEEDRTYKLRSDLEFTGMENLTWYGGMEWERIGNQFSGRIPENDDIIDPAANFLALDEHYVTERMGGYLETEYRIGSRAQFRMGLRTDYENRSRDWIIDPRFSVQYKIADFSTVRLATGHFHQYAEPFEYNSVSGNPGLNAQQSRHYIGGYEFKKDLLHARVEGYYKTYDDLIIEDEQQVPGNSGYGEAYGADFFFKYSDYLRTPFNGWISYSFLQSERLSSRQTRQGINHSYSPSAFDITHNLNVVGKMQIIGMLTGGLTYRYSTGLPFTPVVDGEPTSKDYYLPIEGAIHSQRLPNFHRLDMNLSYYWIPAENWSIIFLPQYQMCWIVKM